MENHGHQHSVAQVCHQINESAVIIFFDTEFTKLHWSAKIISIGLVAEDGRDFYAELNDTYDHADCSDFVLASVLPLLDGPRSSMSSFELTHKLGAWFEDFERPLALFCDAPAWDWPFLRGIFQTPGTWPPNVSRKERGLTETQNPSRLIDSIKNHPPQGRRLHHALDDAKAIRAAWIQTGSRFKA